VQLAVQKKKFTNRIVEQQEFALPGRFTFDNSKLSG